jgi:hypothetical protein
MRGRRSYSFWSIVVLWGVFLGVPLPGFAASTIDIRPRALEKLLTDPSQPTGGRKFLNGKEGDACGWSYVRSPKVEIVGQRIKLSALLRGAFAVSGGCLKMPDELAVEVLAQPIYDDGILSLDKPEIHIQGEAAGGVSSLLLGSLLKLVRVPVRQKILGLMTPSPDGVTFKLGHFDVSKLEVLPDSVRLTVSFGLEVQ